MFTLVKEKCKFFRVKRGQSARELERVLLSPVKPEPFAGAIIAVRAGLKIYYAHPGDTFASVAAKFCVAEEELEKLNGGGCIYPTRTIFVPPSEAGK